MSKVSKVVIGSNYGDEGKGLLTDYFCRQFDLSEKVLNIRFNGGAQAGHTVAREDGFRHVFSHFGSGSFNENVITVLDKEFVLNPILFRTEHEKLQKNGVKITAPYIYSDGVITLPMDMMVNQFIERARGNGRHGSCGVGINETVVRHENEKYRLIPYDCVGKSIKEIVQMLTDEIGIYDYYPGRISELGISLSDEQRDLFYNENLLYAFASDLVYMLNNTQMFYSRSDLLYGYENFVFEGAQGLLLDKDCGVYATPSHTGLENIVDWFKMFPHDVEVCYVTRSYFTRHGAGPFETECQKHLINPMMVDKTNFTNEFQGSFRYGFFDLDLFNSSLSKQHQLSETISSFGSHVSEGIAVTHLNETDWMIVCKDKSIHLDDFESFTGQSVEYFSCRENRVMKKLKVSPIKELERSFSQEEIPQALSS